MPINSKHPEYLLQESDWEDCRRFYEGEKEVKGAGTIYLPKPEGQKTKEYNNYKQRAFFLGAVEPTIVGLVGAVDRKPPTVSVPTGIEDRLYDIDNDGTSLRVFSKAILAEQLLMGRVGILVDRLPEGDTPPYFVKYTAEDIYNWIEVKGVPTLVVLRETYYEQKDSDMYEQTLKTRFRELYLEKGVYKQRVWLPKGKSSAIAKDEYVADDEIIPTIRGVSMNFIPFIFCGTYGLNATVEKSPTVNLVRKNIEHYRVSADYAAALYFVGNPFIVAPGVGQDAAGKIVIGSSKAIGLPADADVRIVECTGHGVNPLKDKLAEIKEEMLVLGARLLEAQKRAAESAEAMRIRESSRSSTLMNSVISVSAGLEKALSFIALWESLPDSSVEFKLNQDFVDIEVKPDLIRALSEQVDKGYMSWETMFYNLAVGELIPEGLTSEEEKDKIAQGGPQKKPEEGLADKMFGPENIPGGIPQGGRNA